MVLLHEDSQLSLIKLLILIACLILDSSLLKNKNISLLGNVKLDRGVKNFALREFSLLESSLLKKVLNVWNVIHSGYGPVYDFALEKFRS